MSAIELGDVTAGPAQAPEPPIVSRALVRTVLAAVAVLALALTSASGRPQPSRMVRPMWSVAITDLSQYALNDDALFVLNNGLDLTAYELADGRVRWSKRLTEPQTVRTAEDLASLLLPSGYKRITKNDAQGLSTLESVPAATLSLNPATGIERWRFPGTIGHRDTVTALLVEADPRGGLPKTFRRIRIADGAVLWEHAAGHPDYWIADAGHLVTLGADGRAEVYGMSDGVRVSDGRPLPGRKDDSTGVEVDATALYLKHNEGGRLTVAAFDLATLRPRWTVDAGDTAREAHLCGAILCVGHGAATSGYDLSTGQPRWQAPGWINAAIVTGGRLLAERAEGAGEGLLDAATGTLQRDLGSGYPVWDTAAGTPSFLLRDTTKPPGRTAVFRIDERSGRRQLRGSIDGLPGKTCLAARNHLICLTTNGRLTVVEVA